MGGACGTTPSWDHTWQQSRHVLRGAAPLAGFLLALLTERCLFVDVPPFGAFFRHELDFRWERHRERLAAAGHDPAALCTPIERKAAGYQVGAALIPI